MHRLDGPAIELVNGSKAWLHNGLCHQTDGPAVEWADGTKKWYRTGRLHREDGPAVKRANGTREYWIDGIELSYNEFITKAEIEKLLGYPVKVVKW